MLTPLVVEITFGLGDLPHVRHLGVILAWARNAPRIASGCEPRSELRDFS